MSVRPYVRKFHRPNISTRCLGRDLPCARYPGDIKQAQKRAAEAKNGVEIGYAIPKEGAQLWFDNLVIPEGRQNVARGPCADQFLLKPEVAAKNSNLVHMPWQWREPSADRHRRSSRQAIYPMSGR